MAKSKAQKHRAHLERNGQRNPELGRNFDPDFSTHERKTKTLQEKRNKQESKYKHRQIAY